MTTKIKDETVNIDELTDEEIQRYEEGAEAEAQMYRTADARAMLDCMTSVYARAEERFALDEKLGKQKIFLSRLFRPCVLILSSDTRRTVAIDDFIPHDRQTLKHDADRAVAYPAESVWTWTEETRAISESLSANNRSVSILMIEVMRVLRSELQQLIDADEWLANRLRTLTEAEITAVVEHYQRHDHQYFMTVYPQKTVEDEVAEAEAGQESYAVYQRRLLEADMRAYPAAVKRRGFRSGKGEQEIEERIRAHGPDLMSKWKRTLETVDADAETPTEEGGDTDGDTETD